MMLLHSKSPLASLALALSINVAHLVGANAAEFNYEVEGRIIDRLKAYMQDPVTTNLFISNFRFSGRFPHYLRAADRDDYLGLNNALLVPNIYYGLEDGSISGFYKGGDTTLGYYREPGDSGYKLDDQTMQKHLKSCINKDDGSQADCILAPGASFVQCVDSCELELCQDEGSQKNCSAIESAIERGNCEDERKYCKKYEITSMPMGESTQLGYVPITNFCHDVRGLFTQAEGAVVKSYVPSTINLGAVTSPSDGSNPVYPLGNCYHADGKTLVNRTLSGDYAYCGGDGRVCNGTFVGGYESSDYDPRYRPWYIKTKETQRSIWMEPFPFYTLGMGITYATPIYDIEDGKKVFAGVLAVDYKFEDIGQFLVDLYGNTTTSVIIFESSDPQYIIAASTGSPAATLVLSEDNSQPCPVTTGDGVPCDPVRIKLSDFHGSSGKSADRILVKASLRHFEDDFPIETISVKDSDGVNCRRGDAQCQLFISQSTLYEQPGANLKWRVVITQPALQSASDSIELGNPLLGAVISIGFLGIVICLGFFAVFYRKRKERAIAYHDWCFTCIFLVGCALFNSSSFALLGPNINATCMVRMWSFHMTFAMALAPLWAKVWRIYKLVGTDQILKRTIGHKKVVLQYILPIISPQVVILIFISIFDPPRQAEVTTTDGGTITQHIICNQNSDVLMITELIYEAGLVLAGCVLAYKTHHIDKKFSESKQLIFAMYNIALAGIVFVLVIVMADIEPDASYMLQAVGVFWGTTISACAIVIPSLIEASNDKKNRANRGSIVASEISGMSTKPKTAIYHSQLRDQRSSLGASNS